MTTRRGGARLFRPAGEQTRHRGPDAPLAPHPAGGPGGHSIAAVAIRAQLAAPDGGGGGGPAPTPAAPAAALSPYRVMFSMAQITNPGCRVPDGSSGAAKVAKYRVIGPDGPANRVTVGEQFSMIEDTHSVFAALTPNSYTTGRSGEFDDCYRVVTREPLPSDFRLKVEQNHLIGGAIASKQHITFTPGMVFICVFERRGDGFAERCRRF